MQGFRANFSRAACVVLLMAGCVEEGEFAQSSPSPTAVSATAQTVAVTRGKTREEIALEREVRDLDQITSNIIVSNTIQGAIAGAVGGCVLARLNGRDCRDGAIAGGLLGGLAGNQIGQAAAEAKRDLVKADETLAKLRGVQQKLSGIETSLQAVLRRQNSEIASLRRQLAAGQVTQSAVNSRIGSINSNRAAVINGLQAGETNIAREKAELVSLERESGQNLRTTKRAVDSTQARIRSLRNTVRIVSN